MRTEVYRQIRELGLSVSHTRTGHHRINFIGGKEATAHYAETLEEALECARKMARGLTMARRTRPRTAAPPELDLGEALLDAAHSKGLRAAAKGVIVTATEVLSAFPVGRVPPYLRDEVAALAKAAARTGLLLALAIWPEPLGEIDSRAQPPPVASPGSVAPVRPAVAERQHAEV